MQQHLHHIDSNNFEQRHVPDRRTQHLKAVFCSLYKARRRSARRQEAAKQPFYTDFYESWVGLTVLAIVCLSVTDAMLTLQILARGGTEVNPLMAALLDISDGAFILGKLAITVTCLFIALVHINFKVLKVIPMRSILVMLLLLYCGLVSYQVTLLAGY